MCHAALVLGPDQAALTSHAPAGAFATTHWSVVLLAGDGQSPEAGFALAQLCKTYWYPLYVFVRRKGYSHEDACDLTQAFFARFLEKRCLLSADVSRGKFRTFLLASLTNFLSNEWDKTQAQRRGGGCTSLSLDEASAEARYEKETADHETPERVFERRWVQTQMGLVLDRLAKETDGQRFEVLKEFLLEDKGALRYDEAGKRLNMSVAAITSAIHRMRARFRVLLYEEIANTVATPAEVELEIRDMMAALSD
jgi:RNA polymerase sigma-70 factor (ECF subfamily)